ncbi:hypothetical protein BB561_003102 [Smittium simulii]|uniref:Fcf2 pre-rRNA processing C-terminal domain-containing protein n=1 Tax=Smittium simulii TaxID=133385 RepID=A0A2T9YMW4_9FUNG|nr:hypothetical protein BB561_003102 [Smittium simulii]
MDSSKLTLLLEKARTSLLSKDSISLEPISAPETSLSKPSVINLLNQYAKEHSSSTLNSAISIQNKNSTIVVKLDKDKLSTTNKSAPNLPQKRDPTITHATNAEKKARNETAGLKWFDMKSPPITEQVKRDLQLLKMRNFLDPKRFYKRDSNSQAIPKHFQFGTIIEGPTEFYSSRLTKKQRKDTIVEELMADSKARSYYKKKYGEIQSKKQSGGKNFYKKVVKKRSNRK